MLFSFLISLILAAVVILIVPKRYDATARLFLDLDDSDALGLEQLQPLTGLDTTTRLQTQMRILESDTLAWAVIKQTHLYDNPAFAGRHFLEPALMNDAAAGIDDAAPELRGRLLKRFQKNLDVVVVPKTEILEVRFRSGDPQLAATVVNSLANLYIERKFKTKYESAIQASDWLTQQLDDLKRKAEDSQKKLADYQQQTGLLGTDEVHNVVMAKLEQMNEQLSTAEGDRIVREAKYRLSLTEDPQLVATIEPESVLSSLRKQQADLRAQLAQMNAKYGPSYPRVIQAKAQLADVEAAVSREVKLIGKQLQNEYLAALRSEQLLSAAVERKKQEAYKINGQAMQFAMLKRDVDSSRDLYEDLLKRLKEAGIVAGLKSSNVNIIDPASVPAEPGEPRVALYLALGGCLGLVSGIGAAFLRERMDGSIRTPEDVELYCEMPSLGLIPRIADDEAPPSGLSLRSKLAILERPSSQFAEAFRALRTSILLSSPGTPPKVIVITSSVPQEGKSVTSVNCAAVLAQAGRKVLLIDADMRKPTIHQHLGVAATHGLSALLSQSSIERRHPLTVSNMPNLEVITAGERPPNPAELLASERMQSLLNEWRGQYDQIVIDTPPVLAVTDAVILASIADSVVLVARSGHTSSQSLRRTAELLTSVNAKLAGVVVNDLAPKSLAYSDYYGHPADTMLDYHRKSSAGV
jgi:exopolysaccharide transport family protein